MRGEHLKSINRELPREGSSPHARGAHRRRELHARRRGIIPACAGSTRTTRTTRATGWDHPRMRGEHSASAPRRALRAGSSPHARGAQVEHALAARGDGIIPACAGSTATWATAEFAPADHPRMRGEHTLGKLAGVVAQGSSPHARGALVGDVEREDLSRIIPACAGSTGSSIHTRHKEGDHPRMRGEHPTVRGETMFYAGSSPHARGARPARGLFRKEARIIPACAGSTTPCCC